MGESESIKVFCPKCGFLQSPGRYCIFCGASAAEMKDHISHSMRFEAADASAEREERSEHEKELDLKIANRQAELKSIETKIDEYSPRILDLDHAVLTLDGQKRELEKENSLLLNQNEELQKQLEEKRREQSELDAKLKAFESANSSLLNQTKEFLNELQDKRKQQSELEKAIASLADRKRKFEEENSSLADQNQNLEKQLQDKRKQHRELENQIQLRQADSLEWLGKIEQRCEEFDRSEELYNKALEIRKRLGDEAGSGVTLDMLLGLAKERGSYAKAEEYGLKALEIHRRLGDRQNEEEVARELRAIRDMRKAN